MRRSSRVTLALSAALGLLASNDAEAGTIAASSPAPAPSVSTAEPWREEIGALLERRAAALEAGDLDAFLATSSGAPAAFRTRQRSLFQRLRALGVASYRIVLDDDGYGDLSAALGRQYLGDEIRVVQAQQQVRFRDIDVRPATGPLYLTLLRSEGAWSLVADDDLEDLGLLSQRDPWDFGPVRSEREGGVTLWYHSADRAQARRLLAPAADAVTRATARWPLSWRKRALVIVPGSVGELERVIQSTFDLDQFVAFATGTARAEDRWRLGGHRVYVQPKTFFASGASFRADVLSHEMIHLASFEAAGSLLPSWLAEGLAQVHGESRVRSQALRASVRAGAFDGTLPDDVDFFTGGRTPIRRAYETGASFVQYLNRRFGRDAGANLLRSLGENDPVAPGTWRYHLDRAARDRFGEPLSVLRRAWAAEVERTYR